MFNKRLCFALITLLVISNVVYSKKTKKNKRPKDQDESTTLQPNVVAYSTFGFNDVGAYDGFVPTSPDYASFLSGVNQESTTRLYAPAFPSSLDSTGFSGNFGSQSGDAQFFGGNEDMGQPGMLQYTSSSMNFFNNPNFGAAGEQNKNVESEDTNGKNAEDSDAPVYGTKISRNKYRSGNVFNNTEYNMFNGGVSTLSNNKYSNIHESEATQESKPSFAEAHMKYQNNNGFDQNFEHQENEDFGRPSPTNNGFKFQKVVDFTKINYPTAIDTSQFLSGSVQSLNPQNSLMTTQFESSFSNNFNYNNINNNNHKITNSPPKQKDHYNIKDNEESSDKSVVKSSSFFEQDNTLNHVNNNYKHNTHHGNKNSETKKKIKKPWSAGNYSNDFKNWKDASSIKGYGYSTNFSNMNFKYGVSESKNPFNHDEIVPASSNVDLTNYQYPESSYSNFKKLPEFNDDEDYASHSFKDKFKANDYFNQFKNSFSTVPTTTSYWGNAYKTSDYSSYKDHPKKSHFSETGDTTVNIPKRPRKPSFTKTSENKQNDWPSAYHSRPQKLNKPTSDWSKDLFDTRYKSEEDLLGLRTHDTSHPTYLPTYKPSNNVFDNDSEFKNLVDKWRQSYLKTKFKDVRDYESYGSEMKPTHVPIPKPYPIEVPHPVIVPVPRPFPVRVPVSRPVAVPVLREITVPIEKPVPYPVYKTVPYPVEKLVPVPVEKEVAVPVEKPYPVHIPYVRPVFHHTKPVHEDPENDHFDGDDYMRRPDAKRPTQFKKRPYGTRNKSRRPSRASFQDRNRRRWPERRRPSGYTEHRERHHSRPSEFHPPPYKHHEYERDEDDENSDYARYCRRTGNC
ncbi:putative uncharacterized protein DDB_G0282133 isoform X1 [Trichoplusia ni]|uniref:Uncharacterized protein n=1 Tax=Trichoplusia ni TaxID=7111 RepID=A0A7E5WH97_TRINI|nr:putative uncharacterized protein DDB_G0282133 isoform X1 [Trichoplusia ni]